MKFLMKDFLRDEPLTESLLIEFVASDNLASVTIVYDYAAESVAKSFAGKEGRRVRNFRKLTFDGVVNFTVTTYRGASGTVAYEQLQERIVNTSVVVQSARLTSESVLELELSQSFIVKFDFKSVTFAQRKAIAKSHGENAWSYHDLETSREIAFANPFD